ncbi:MAG: DUF6702 family protein [Flavobacteriaceae bacterium]
MVKKIKILLLVFILPCLVAAGGHKFYVSTTKIEYKEDKKTLQIITKLFIDDIEDVLQERYHPEISLATNKETKVAEDFLKKYVLQKFKITIDGKETLLTYIGREYDVDVVKIYLEATEINTLKTLQVENKILFEISPDQQNIVHVKIEDKKKSLILDKDNPNGLLNF